VTWLLRSSDVLAAIEPRDRGWQRSLQGAVVVRRPAVVRTVTAAGELDVAWCVPATEPTGGLVVVRVATLGRRRVAVPLRACALVVAPAAAFDRWGLRVGDCLEVRGE